MSQNWKNAVVIGASSGIGKAIAEELLKHNINVAVVARRMDKLQEIADRAKASNGSVRVLCYEHDVRNYAEVEPLFQTIAHDLGGLDLVVYASGVMPNITENEYTFSKDFEMMEVNIIGAIAWLNEAAKRFEQTKKGTIIGISSIAGERGRRGNPIYCTSKAALTTYLESLRNRLGRYGVKVVTIKPGFIDTDMTRGKPGLFWLISAEQAAKESLRAAQHGRSSAFVPGKWWLVATIIKMIPSFLFRYLGV